MAFQTISTMMIAEILRRWHAGHPISTISLDLRYDRKTIREYINKAIALGLTQDSPLPIESELIPMIQSTRNVGGRVQSAQSFITPFKEQIKAYLTDRDNKLKPKSVYEVLCENNEAFSRNVSYSSFKRYIRIQKIKDPRDTSTCRIETPPGQQVQIDYGEVGLLFDPELGRRRKIYAFIGTLGFSRHKFVDIVFSQNKESFVASNVRMFEFFGGVTESIRLDNLKSGVIKPDLYDPVLNPAYREFGLHYDTFIDPCRPGSPKDKGKVERDVPTIREAVHKLRVLHPTATLAELNRLIRTWVIEVYGMRNHGTTYEQPFVSFTEQEKPILKPLPQEPFEIAEWKQATVHADHYIQFNKKTFSLPTVNIGRTLWVRGNGRILQAFDDLRMIKQWVLIPNKKRYTDHADFPKNVQYALDDNLHQVLCAKARAYGKHVDAMVQSLMKEHAFINLRRVQGIVALGDKYDHAMIDRAAACILLHKDMKRTPKQLKWVIDKMMNEQLHDNVLPISPETQEFIDQGSLGITQSLTERAS
jgi:hypothetical protein